MLHDGNMQILHLIYIKSIFFHIFVSTCPTSKLKGRGSFNSWGKTISSSGSTNLDFNLESKSKKTRKKTKMATSSSTTLSLIA